MAQEAEPSGGLVVLPGESISKYVGHIGGVGEPEGIDATGEAGYVRLTSQALRKRTAGKPEPKTSFRRAGTEEPVDGFVLSLEPVEVSEEPLAEAETEVQAGSRR